ncbi:hypothetical protein KY290_020798 [Solanum tuberosum]|uniref:Protein kinase domain-containing protein n=1 Tax=Solanum tuberosum TaxID=4113 RepID=A0ABQ7UZN5_SOLTU|nr:hypothetical protein KY285_019770 [Solanum tuberosum]KAH0757305.1 hypothetical protein KY290_020798 [Solanum tuberosum]
MEIQHTEINLEKHIFLLILLFLIQFSISLASSNETDQQALLAFQNIITSPNHFLANNWTKNTSFCSWFGVTCTPKTQRVVALALPNLQLQGTISPSLANLSFLSVLNLENNSFHGGIPDGLGHLPCLRVIDVKNNQLNGSIPTSLFQNRRVQVISLALNELSGEMWRGPWYVPELIVLNLRNNSLTGMIPPSVGNATKMMNFSLSGNRVSGNIPKEVGNLSQLAFLSLFDNQLTGSIPPTLFNISSLLAVSLPFNSLSGPLLLDEGNIVSNLRIVGRIPPELGKLSNLRQLSFDNNSNLIGQIPEAIFNISSLELIGFAFNNLSGRIQATTAIHLPNLKELFLGVNQLEGEIPLFITNASKLETLSLARSFLTGTIPTNLGNLRELRNLFLYDNQLTNEPTERELRFFNSLADCWMLRYISVGSNPLNSVLPNSIGNLSSTIEYIYIGDAHINGPIPTSIGNMSGLTSLVFNENNLMGSIPPEIGKLKLLQGLYLLNNKLQGHIPETVCHLSNLVQLYLDGNELSGLIPECLGNLSMLQHLYLDSNKFSSKFSLSLWNMSGLLYLDVSQNSIEGEVPSDIGGLKAIVELHLSNNHFSGMISTRFGELQNLQYLDLSNNSFFGQIPLSFANLINLEFLNLSLNALSGSIPKSLEKLSYLKSINVSFNDLEGEIPSGGVFANSTLQSFLGNKGLCGMHILDIPACDITNPGKQSKLKEVLLKIVTPAVTSSFLIFLLVSIWIMKRQKKGRSKDVEKVLEIGTHQLVSYHEIQRATNNFDESNLIGEGSSGSVYKGTLFGGTAVAIKVLDLENEQVSKRFDTECEVMRNVRHRNLVSVITTCSSDYIRAFVLRYMPNGSLENWLYEEDRHLNLHQRVTVMIDAAMAVEYLHHGHVTSIVHCDLKPANILLDEAMVVHVGDFGISKILAISKSIAYTETLGTLGYIAPEGIVSTCGDVYSYGIMLMEVLTKRRPTDEEICNENLDLRKWITQSFSGTMMDVVDANMFSEEEQITCKSEICIASMIELALDCTKETPESRVTMKEVVKRLNKINNTFQES